VRRGFGLADLPFLTGANMLKIQPSPTFTSRVEIPTPEGIVPIKVEFKHMDTDAYEAFIKSEAAKNRSNEETICDIAVGWSGVDSDFTPDNVRAVCKAYHAAAGAIVATFISELTQAKEKNFVR
jgi:hypothetical protein